MRDGYLRKKLSLLLAMTLVMTCMLPIAANAASFTDVSGHWAETFIAQASERALVEGYNGLYRPNDSMSRAELVTILWRAVGQPEPQGKASFTDLSQDWYMKPVAWAEENKVVNGVGEGKFDPDGKVTREQLATVLMRLSGESSGMEMMFTSIYDWQYPDSGEISSFAKTAIYWSIYNSIYCGEASTNVGATLEPKADATRAQIAVMIIRYLDRE